MNEKFIEKLKVLSKRKTCMDNFDGTDTPSYYCGNADDTYSMGMEDGTTELAREILNEMGIE